MPAQRRELARTKLEPGEQVLRRWRGNRRTSPRAATGGYLYLTTERLLFEPHWFERLLGRATWVTEHDDVDDVGRRISRSWAGHSGAAWLSGRSAEARRSSTVRRVPAAAAAIRRAIH
jgi:hypothetical protein